MKCATKQCRNERAKRRTLCHKCKARRYAKNNPIQISYQNLRGNAKKRGKQFDLTFDEFKEWAVKTEYMMGKGKSKNGFHVDRIREYEGYNINNIQVLTNSQNVKKYLKYAHDQKGKPTDFKMQEHTEPAPQEDVPF